jgi:hypothetical protein
MTPEKFEELISKYVEILGSRQRAYQLVFNRPADPAIAAVLQDLAVFCRADETCIIPGDRDRTYVLEGRREVWLRIRHHIDLTTEQLTERYPLRPAKGAHGHDPRDPPDPA